MILELSNISKSYGSNLVLSRISFCVEKHEIVCLVGHSGCGKSTTLNIIAGLLKADAGEIKNNSPKISYVFQEDRLLPWKTVYENIKLVAEHKSKKEIYKMIYAVDLSGFENKYPSELSGGMRQRVAIARAFIYEADLLLMDEPFKSLDYALKINMLDMLVQLWKKSNISIVFVTHDIDEALLTADRVIIYSKRPARVVRDIAIDIPQEYRELHDEKLIRIKNDIMSLIV
ncbi:ABC transporter ATP-binding protein [Peptococcaceae bacterium]|nr:ABC transporter ATP-binding protein [Peptococcaceae bacterium]MCL0077629.1 ABC transporter ATP-binding protein [Peptococcaceae bacterium]